MLKRVPQRLAAGSVDLGRRMVCRLLALAGLGVVSGCSPFSSDPPGTPPPDPLPEPVPTPEAGTVVHAHAPGATGWDGQTDFWNYVSQAEVDQMVDEGMMALTGTSSVTAAWESVLPSYQAGEVVAIKANLNNAGSCSAAGPEIDALMEPINAVVRGLKQIGVAEADICVYDAVRALPDRFTAAARYPGVRYFSAGPCAYEAATFNSSDPDATVAFSPPAGVPPPATLRVTDVLVDATYLINMPILKTHGIAGVTLGFKNHFGTIQLPSALHAYVGPGNQYFRTDYSALLDLFRNPHIADKTILTIGDGLLGALGGCCSPPVKWNTFNNQVPNSLFFATDPVAIDCVMCDFLAAEQTIPADAAAYLELADAAGLGTFERGDPWGAGYGTIDYVRLDL
ncbi:MAG: DUF362 domain-containing protein [Planctomycetota bacterium]